MLGCVRRIGLLSLLILLSAPLARAQAPSPEALAAAKELIVTIHLDEQLSAVLPGIIKNLKPSIVQGRSEVDRQYDALAPLLLEGFKARMSELSDAAGHCLRAQFLDRRPARVRHILQDAFGPKTSAEITNGDTRGHGRRGKVRSVGWRGNAEADV
jgi:hypothetical protein